MDQGTNVMRRGWHRNRTCGNFLLHCCASFRHEIGNFDWSELWPVQL